MIEKGEVCYRKNGSYRIRIIKSAKCNGCKACGFGRKNHIILPAVSQIECDIGDTVNVRMPEKSIKGAYVYLYLVPLLFLFAGIMIPYNKGETFMMIGGAIGLATGFLTTLLIEKLFKRRKVYMPTILEKISETKEITDD